MAELTYEKELWDGMKKVTDRYDEGAKTVKELLKFLTEKQKIETDYAKGLQGLVAKSTTTETRTIGAAWASLRNDHESQHKLRLNLAQTVTKDLATELGTFRKEMEKEKDNLNLKYQNLQREYEKQNQAVIKAKTAYHIKSKEAENALLAYEKAQQDPTHPPKTLTKLNTAAQKVKKEAEVCDAAYQDSVKEFQSFQVRYQEQVKGILKDFQVLEEKRVDAIRSIFEKFVNAQDALHQELTNATQELKDVVKTIDGHRDVQEFIAENRTGLIPAKPTEYEPYKWLYEHPSVPASQKSKMTTTTKRESATINSSATSQKNSSNPSPIAMQAAKKSSSDVSTASTKKARALYDYAASDDTELSFDVDDIIVITNIDDSGWWEGENKGKKGLFPGNYVELITDTKASPATSPASAVKKCRVLYDFNAENDDELTIQTGEIITIDTETEGWFSGTNQRGQSGMFPANYVEIA